MSLSRIWKFSILSLILHASVFGGIYFFTKGWSSSFEDAHNPESVVVDVGVMSGRRSERVGKSTMAPALMAGHTRNIWNDQLSVKTSEHSVTAGRAGSRLSGPSADGDDSTKNNGLNDGTKQASAKEKYYSELRTMIESQKVYPSISRKLHETGRITIAFTVHRDGSVDRVILKNGSSYSRLNKAATDLISGIKKYKPLPADIEGNELDFEIPINYSLE